MHKVLSHCSLPMLIIQELISAVGDEFNFLKEYEFVYDSSSESEQPGPFSRSFQALDNDREDDMEREGR